MVTVKENTTGIERTTIPGPMPNMGEPYSENERQISCFFEFDGVNKLYYAEDADAMESEILDQFCGIN